MIGKLTGTLLEKTPPLILIEVHGIGYEVSTSMNTLSELPDTGKIASLLIHSQTRDDGTFLYGFINSEEKLVFRELIKISGVGPKLALAILSGMSVVELGECVVNRQPNRLVKLPGVGKKTAERLVVELQDRLDKITPSGVVFSQLLMSGKKDDSASKIINESISALISLGYKTPQARSAVDSVFDDTLTRDEIIKLALQKLAG